ncbi:MAG: hypothetical protein N3B16_12150, partial [Candidatus Aminicenantes bacterium]|nr:hypothetical protein [Candidatus Aminicenantes bacterium]
MSWKKFYNQFSIIIYLSFLFFWFKDNLPPLREINFNRHVFLLLLIIIGTHKFLVCLKRKPNIFQAAKPNSQTILALSFLALLLIISRLPWLLYYQGLFSSDDAIPALMAKHISEGKTPPICFYGQLYIGSLPSHVMAIFFRIFGYSPLLFQLVTLSFYYSFVVVNFFLLKKLFSFSFAIIVSIFYCLPIGVLKEVSFDNTLVAPFWLFLGTSLIVLAYLIAFENKYHLAHFLGFLMGLSFWTHPITIYFILTSLFILTVKSKFIFKRYGVIGLYFFLGFFPMIMQEIYYKFHLIKFLTAGDKYLNLIKVDQTAKMISRLFLPSGQLFLAIFLILICLGIIILIKRAIEKKQFFSQEAILPFFFFVFLSIYLFSGHS